MAVVQNRNFSFKDNVLLVLLTASIATGGSLGVVKLVPGARSDAFTGAEGRKLTQAIADDAIHTQSLENRVSSLERQSDRSVGKIDRLLELVQGIHVRLASIPDEIPPESVSAQLGDHESRLRDCERGRGIKRNGS